MNPTDASDAPTREGFREALDHADRFALADVPRILLEKVGSWLEFAVRMLPNVVIALVVLVAAWLVAKGIASVGRRTLDRFSHHREVNRLLEISLRVSVTALGMFVALSIVNLDGVVVSLLAGVGGARPRARLHDSVPDSHAGLRRRRRRREATRRVDGR